MNAMLKSAVIALSAAAFLAEPLTAVDADARRGYSRRVFRMLARRSVPRSPSAGSALIELMAGAAVGAAAGEMAYDALKQEDGKAEGRQKEQVPRREEENWSSECRGN